MLILIVVVYDKMRVLKNMFLKCMLAAAAIVTSAVAEAVPFMTNVYGRDYMLLNGKWSAFTDPL